LSLFAVFPTGGEASVPAAPAASAAIARPDASPAAAAAKGVAASRLRRVIPIFESSTFTPDEWFESASFVTTILFERMGPLSGATEIPTTARSAKTKGRRMQAGHSQGLASWRPINAAGIHRMTPHPGVSFTDRADTASL
jgi:hypothetical protein